MSVKIISDSACDIVESREDLEILPITITIDGVEYQDGVDLTHIEFYEKLVETDGMPATSQINPMAFRNAFQRAVEDGFDVVVITLSSKLSGTYENALAVAGEFGDCVHVVDSMNAAIGEQILVMRALELVAEGLSAGEIADRLEEEKGDIRLIAMLDTLEYLSRGGRISQTTATFGNVLSIKPVVAVVDGEVAMLGKARGSRKGGNLLVEQIARTNGIDFDRPYMLAYSGFDDSMLEKYIEDSRRLWEDHVDDLPKTTIGATIGTHIGPGAIGVAFFQKAR